MASSHVYCFHGDWLPTAPLPPLLLTSPLGPLGRTTRLPGSPSPSSRVTVAHLRGQPPPLRLSPTVAPSRRAASAETGSPAVYPRARAQRAASMDAALDSLSPPDRFSSEDPNAAQKPEPASPSGVSAVYPTGGSTAAAGGVVAGAAGAAAGAAAGGGKAAPMPCILSIAGSDSGAGAGIQADIKAAAARGVWCTTVVSALTAQNTLGVQAVYPTPPEFVQQQIQSVLSDIGAQAIKTGMLPNQGVIETVCRCLQEWAPQVPLVVDPVLVATSGDSLSDGSTLDALRNQLLPMATLVTPNLREAEVLLDLPIGSICDLDGMRRAAQKLVSYGSRAVLVKGGHLPNSDESVDIFFNGSEMLELGAQRIETKNTHGTGCTLSSAIASQLALGHDLTSAVREAKEYLHGILECSVGLHFGSGSGSQGPLNHLPTVALPDRSVTVGDVTVSLMPGRSTSSSPSLPLSSPSLPPSSPSLPPSSSSFPPSVGRTSAAVAAGRAVAIPFDARKHLRLYAVTDSRMNARWGRSLSDAVLQAVQGGATIVQVREKELDTGAFIKEVSAALRVTRELGIPLLVNDRVDVALACDTDGVHVGQSDMPASLVRKLLGPGKIIGVSSKSVEHAQRAAEEGADYIGVGGVFPTNTKENNKTIGIEGLLEVCKGSSLPVVAIGGINASNASSVFTRDRPEMLCGVAVVSALFNQEDVLLSTQRLLDILANKTS